MSVGKTEFNSTEDVVLGFEPFVDPSDGTRIDAGTDVVTLEIEKPDGTLLGGGPYTATWHPNVNQWRFILPVANLAGQLAGDCYWRIMAWSDHDSLPEEQWRIVRWGKGIAEDLLTLLTVLGTPAGASVSADIADIKNDTTSVAVDAANAAASALAADTKATDIQTKVNFIHKLKKNGARILGNQEIFYDDDGTTEILKFDLFDENGQATSTRIFRRIPAP